METTNHKNHALIILATAFVVLFLMLPLLFVLFQAFAGGVGPYIAHILDPYAVKALGLTLLAMAVAVAVNTVLGLFAAYAVTKFTFPGRKFLTTAMDLPLSVSPVIAGLIYVLTFGRSSPLYPFLMAHGLKIVYAVPGVLIATIFTTLPYVSRELIPVLSAQGRGEEEAAALMGAGGFTIFRRVTFPHIKWPLLYGVVLCSARAMGEFGAVSVLSGHLRGVTNTLPLHIEILYNEFHYAEAFAASSILVFLALVILVVRSLVERQGKQKET